MKELEHFIQTNSLMVHVPKCAGIAISKSLYNGRLYGGHPTVTQLKSQICEKLYQKMYKFAVVRNPWDRFVSAYFFFKKWWIALYRCCLGSSKFVTV